MRLGDMLFKLYRKNEIMSESELEEIEKGYRKWKDEEAPNNKVTRWLVEKQEIWWVRMLVAGVYMIVQKWVYDWMHPDFESEDDDDDDDDDRRD